ncbi:tetraspanin-7-like [Acanthaster planci]|uniref:Tetraspanin n=1 Tax=Acanthaster planci TaxID=133434 RepID=A0A8B7YMX0_ACAPL|nr:tetraspanin-7-like [Acanthaster planci]
MPKQMQTTAAMAVVKLLLTIFNLIFWVVGIALLAVGIWGIFELKYYLELSDTDYSNVEYVLIGTGSFMIAAGIIGCCATVKNIAWLLQLYGVMVFVIFIALLAAGISGFVYRNRLEEGFRKGLDSKLKTYKSRDEPPDTYIDKLQKHLLCCGSRNYTDWLQADTEWFNTHPKDEVPDSCCNATVDKDECSQPEQAIPIRVDNGTLLAYREGCSEKVTAFLDNKMSIIGGSALGFAFFQLIGIILAFGLAKLINTNKYEMM